MKASEARELMNNKPVVKMTLLYEWITNRAATGFYYTWLIDERLNDEQIKELLANGYKVEVKDTDYKISWQ